MSPTKFDAPGPGKMDTIPVEESVHLLPFHLEHDGPAEVEHKFTSLIDSTNPEALTVEFRGRPLIGKKLEIPNVYEGIIMTQTSPTKDTHDSDDENKDKDKTLKLSEKFHSFTYWNWDRKPSGMDDPVKLNDWLEIANELHKPIQVERK